MKVLTFYSAKGGTGKTTFNLLLASYLRYELGKKVLLLDFDSPLFSATLLRSKEIQAVGQVDEAYPIQKVEDQSRERLLSVVRNISSLKDDLDYVVMDFRGSFAQDDAVLLFARYGVIDKVIIPVEMDQMSISSAHSLASVFMKSNQNVLLFFNKVVTRENRDVYDQLASMLRDCGLTVSDHRILNRVHMRRDAGSANPLRSSVMFPTKRIQEENPEIIELFKEVLQ